MVSNGEVVPGAGRRAPTFRSPLFMVAQEPAIERLVHYLQKQRVEHAANPEAARVLRFTLAEVEEARAAFARMILGGERKLHRLCELLVDGLLDSPCALRSVVVGRFPETGEPFTLSQPLQSDDLYSQTDLDLGNRMLSRLRYQARDEWRAPELVANVVEYEALAENQYGVHKLISRIKAEEEIWNKVVDEIFELEALVERDKQLRHLSYFVKDIFGVKIVASHRDDVFELERAVRELEWSTETLERRTVPVEASTRSLQLIEVKDYLRGDRPKSSGWEAVKIVVNWWRMPYEIQLQPLSNYLRERERLTAESHEQHKERRERLRNDVARAVPLFGFYRDLLRWLFQEPSTTPPTFGRTRVELTQETGAQHAGDRG